MLTKNLVTFKRYDGGSPIFSGGQGGGGRDHKKQYICVELPKKGGLHNLLGAWQKIGRRVFLRGG